MSTEPERSHPESGRISILMAGVAAVVLAAVLVGAAVTDLHVQRLRLWGCADALAVAASSAIPAEDYYAAGSLAPTAATAAGAAERELARLAATTCAIGAGARLDHVGVVDGAAHVSLTAQAAIPWLPAWLAGAGMPQLDASSSARTGDA